MKSFSNILVIYPIDPTIDFLQPIVDTIHSILPQSVLTRPKSGEPFDSITDDTELVIFLGHGTTTELLGGSDENGKKSKLFDTQNGAHQLDGCSVVLFSCNSVDYIKNVKANPIEINNFFVFGDMPTDKEHVKHNQQVHKNYWPDFNDEQLEFYKDALVKAVSSGFGKAVMTNSFHGFNKGITHVMNLKINEIILSKEWSKNQKIQVIERLIALKKEIRYADAL